MRKSSAFLLVILLMATVALAACGGAQSTGDPERARPESENTQPAAGGESQAPAAEGEAQEPANSLERIKAEGVLKVGIDASYPPMEFVDEDGKTPIGFDIDLAGAVAEKLGVKAEFTVIDWDGIQAGLSGGHYDAIISSMTITDDRQREMDFVQYMQMGIAYVSRPGVEVKTDADLADKTVVVQEETTAQFYVEDLMEQGIQPKELKSFPYATDAFMDLANGLGDVVAIDAPVAGYYAQLDPDLYRVTGSAEMGEPDPIGIALRKGETELREAIQKAVDDLEADGTIQQLAVKWFGDAAGQ